MSSPTLTPRQAAALVGVSESTVRRWCDAGVVATSKTTGGHRRIDRNVLLAFARDRGLALVDASALTTAGKGGRLPADAELTARLYEQLLAGDERDVQQLAQGLIERTGDPARLCDEVVAPAMHRIGEAWAAGRAPIFREHAATQRAMAAMSVARGRLREPDADAPVALCAALRGDPYALAPAMCSVVMKAAGFRVTLLGPDTPVDEIARAAAELSADVVTISVSVAPEAPMELQRLCERLDARRVRVAIGGRALSAELRRALSPDFFGDTMAHLARYAERAARTLLREARGGHQPT